METEQIVEPEFTTPADELLKRVRKKGRPSWLRFDPLEIPADWKHPNLKYRFVENDPIKIHRRERMGYIIANPESGGALKNALAPDPHGNPVDSGPLRRDLVLMVADAEIEQIHNKEIAKLTDHSVLGMKANRQEEFDKLGREHGIAGAQLRTRMVIE